MACARVAANRFSYVPPRTVFSRGIRISMRRKESLHYAGARSSPIAFFQFSRHMPLRIAICTWLAQWVVKRERLKPTWSHRTARASRRRGVRSMREPVRTDGSPVGDERRRWEPARANESGRALLRRTAREIRRSGIRGAGKTKFVSDGPKGVYSNRLPWYTPD